MYQAIRNTDCNQSLLHPLQSQNPCQKLMRKVFLRSFLNTSDLCVRTSQLQGTLVNDEATQTVKGTLEGAPAVGFLVNFTLNEHTFQGFVLNTSSYSTTVNMKPKPAVYSQTKFSTNDLQGIATLVELGRSVVVENVHHPPPKDVSSTWQCYYEHCSVTTATAELMTAHLKTAHPPFHL